MWRTPSCIHPLASTCIQNQTLSEGEVNATVFEVDIFRWRINKPCRKKGHHSLLCGRDDCVQTSHVTDKDKEEPSHWKYSSDYQLVGDWPNSSLTLCCSCPYPPASVWCQALSLQDISQFAHSLKIMYLISYLSKWQGDSNVKKKRKDFLFREYCRRGLNNLDSNTK